ncbi:MAG: nitroreductase family protein [Deltaproteobacteria bacterium]
MEVLQAIKERRSIRRFKNSLVESSKIELLKQALIWAPSAGNLQKRRFYFVYNDKIKEKLVLAALDQDFIKEAPLVVVGCADMTIRRHYMERGAHLYAIQDVSCSIQNMMLLAHSLGLGSVWVGAFDEDEVSAALRLPDNLMPIVITPVGYPDEFPDPPKRVSSVEAITEVK